MGFQKRSEDSDLEEDGDLEDEIKFESEPKIRSEISLHGKMRLEMQTLTKTKLSLALKIPTYGQHSAEEVASRKGDSSQMKPRKK